MLKSPFLYDHDAFRWGNIIKGRLQFKKKAANIGSFLNFSALSHSRNCNQAVRDIDIHDLQPWRLAVYFLDQELIEPGFHL